MDHGTFNSGVHLDRDGDSAVPDVWTDNHPLHGAVLAVCPILFYSLMVEINGAHLEFRFGPGLIRKRIALDQVTSCCVVRNKFIRGWGIHH